MLPAGIAIVIGAILFFRPDDGGKLHDGDAYISQIPTALNGNSLTALLLGHKVQVTGASPSTSFATGAA
jgi:hypothetical protein